MLIRCSGSIEERHDGGVYPKKRTILGLVLHFITPDPAFRDGHPKIANEFFGMMAGIDEAVILAQQFFPRILGDGAELVVHISDFPPGIRDGDNRVLIERRLQIVDFFQRSLQLFLRPLAFGDVGDDAQKTGDHARAIRQRRDRERRRKAAAILANISPFIFIRLSQPSLGDERFKTWLNRAPQFGG